MPVNVAGQTGTGRFSLVQANVVALWPEHTIEHADHPLNCGDRLGQVGPAQLAQGPPMDQRRNEQVPVVVRITIEHDD
jgi:hypothetical protein